jgi:RNA polymerase sigma-70 factor, ECF subfamily
MPSMPISSSGEPTDDATRAVAPGPGAEAIPGAAPLATSGAGAAGSADAALDPAPGAKAAQAQALPDLLSQETWVSIELLNQAQAGDAQALDDLLRRYEARLRRVVRVRLDAKLRGLCESADVVQETLAAALTRIADLRVGDRGAILRWLTRIAENEMIDMRRRAFGKKRDRNRNEVLHSRHELSAGGKTPAEDAASHEMQEKVDRAVASLPPEQRDVILLRTYCDASWEEVARSIGSPSPDAARKLHHRAMIKLARALQQQD